MSQSTGVITLRHPTVTEPDAGTTAVTGAISSQSITFYSNVGVNASKFYDTPTLIAYQKYRIRFRYFIPTYVGAGGTSVQFDASGKDRNADIDYKPPGSPTHQELPFWFLYGADYDFSDDA